MNHVTNSFSFPVLEAGRADYVDNIKYEVSQVENIDETGHIVLEHKVSENNLIAQLLKSGEAKFVTTVVLKSAMYRETLDNAEYISLTQAQQKIPILSTFEKHSFFPAIVYIGEDKVLTIDAQKMGVDLFWDGASIKLSKGSILARDGWKEFESSASDLLTIRKDESVKYGFNVSIDTSEGGKFVATMQPSLYDSLNTASKTNLHRRSIITHVLCVGFMELQLKYKEEPDDNFVNFDGIKRELQKENLKTWEDEGFNPNQIACKFLPHIMNNGEDNE